MINNTNSFIDCMFMLHQSILYLQIEKEELAFSEFKIFCENAPNHEQLQGVENNVYYRVWKLEGRPTHETHPKITHYDFGRLAFHGQEGRSTSHRALAIQFAYIRVLKKELEKIHIQYKQGDVKLGDQSLNKLLPIQISAASSVFQTSGVLTFEHLFSKKIAAISSKTVLEALLLHGLGEKTCPSLEEKMKATDACILALNCTKFTTNLLPKADDYFKRKSLEISPVDTSHEIISMDQAEDKMKELFGKHQGICFGEGTHGDFFTGCFYDTLCGKVPYKQFKSYFGFFQKMNVKILFTEGSSIEQFLLSGEKSAQRLNIIPIDSKYAKSCSHTHGNVRAELMNYAAAKIINQQRKTLKEGEKFVAWMGRGHLTDIKVIDTYPNNITQERKILGVATLTGCPSIEIRSKANYENVEGWLAGKGDGALQKGFGSERKINGLPVSFQKFPTRANIEIHEK